MRNQQTPALKDEDFRALHDAGSWAELTRLGQAILGRLGLAGFMQKMRSTDAAGRMHVQVLGTLPVDLQEQLRSVDGDDLDPVCLHVNRQRVPLIWDVEDLCGSPAAQPYRTLRALGVQAGWSVGAHSEHSMSRIDIYAARPLDFTQLSLHNDLLLFSCYLNDAASALWLRHIPKARIPVLTEREQECLRWSASGKTSPEIGMILGISQNTVYFHLKKAASKFEVYGTRHAITRAIEMRLISTRYEKK